MLSLEITAALNEQLTLERTAHATYRTMAFCFEKDNLPGMAKFMLKQSNDEQTHADKIAQYLADKDAEVIYAVLEAVSVNKSWTPPDYFNAALTLEQGVTISLKEKHGLVCNQGDPQTAAFLQWFLLEQVEGEKLIEEIIDRFQRAGAGLGWEILDKTLGEM